MKKQIDNRDLGYKGGITALEKSMERFAEELRGEGYIVDVDTLKGSSDCEITGYQSNVELTIEKDQVDVFETFTITANGYGTVMTVAELKEFIREKI